MALHRKIDDGGDRNEADVNPVYVQLARERVPRRTMPQRGMLPDTALQVVRDELILDGNARLNLATFVTTWMEPQARRLMAECLDKNMIDKDEYPQTAELESRCVNILAGHRVLHHRLERGLHARRDGAAVAVAAAQAGGRGRRRPAEPGDGL